MLINNIIVNTYVKDELILYLYPTLITIQTNNINIHYFTFKVSFGIKIFTKNVITPLKKNNPTNRLN